MRFVLKDKLFSLGGDLTIQDEHGQEVYWVDGKVISLGRRLEIKDAERRVVATIQERLIALRDSFDIHIEGGPRFSIARRLFSLFVDRMVIDLPGGGDLEVTGDLFDHEYTFARRGREIAHVSRRWLTLVDAYGVEIDHPDDVLPVLACAVVIDQFIDEERQRPD